jgi:hypothetical protein
LNLNFPILAPVKVLPTAVTPDTLGMADDAVPSRDCTAAAASEAAPAAEAAAARATPAAGTSPTGSAAPDMRCCRLAAGLSGEGALSAPRLPNTPPVPCPAWFCSEAPSAATAAAAASAALWNAPSSSAILAAPPPGIRPAGGAASAAGPVASASTAPWLTARR